jgi:hypothetical protein
MPVLDIRGTHGSGKSWIVRQVLERYRHIAIEGPGLTGKGSRIWGYRVPQVDCGIVGSYEVQNGGCDTIKDMAKIVEVMKKLATEHANVIMEGIFVAHTFKRYDELANDMAAYGYRFFFLNTPLRTCIARVRARRIAKGNEKDLDTTNIERDHDTIWARLRIKFAEAGHKVTVLDYRDPLPVFMQFLPEISTAGEPEINGRVPGKVPAKRPIARKV